MRCSSLLQRWFWTLLIYYMYFVPACSLRILTLGSERNGKTISLQDVCLTVGGGTSFLQQDQLADLNIYAILRFFSTAGYLINHFTKQASLFY